ncbi:MAG: Veg family protein [Candidatus Atribacteria bacterium]|nr:Veg family protein [Candidatus Atribacteria bacterium]
MLAVQSLDQIKEWVLEKKGKEVQIEVNKGRKKTVVRQGIIETTYPFFFTLKMNVEGSCQRVSFNYVDILTKTIELKIV